ITVPWWMEGHAIRVIARDPETPAGTRWPKSVVGVLPLLAYSVGVVLLLASSPAGLVLVAVGSILAVISAVVFAWVVLVEILRGTH
ncbi:hypothetical protein ACC691_39835, partial [Rhizobium johnstonii]|uniref:hypothetical protein n=1 Tax=Rhizobium johnstonii TaxID=3019933 RepID=UPI003F9C4602